MLLESPDDRRAQAAMEKRGGYPTVQGHGHCQVCRIEGWLFERMCGGCREMAEWARQNRLVCAYLHRDRT